MWIFVSKISKFTFFHAKISKIPIFESNLIWIPIFGSFYFDPKVGFTDSYYWYLLTVTVSFYWYWYFYFTDIHFFFNITDTDISNLVRKCKLCHKGVKWTCLPSGTWTDLISFFMYVFTYRMRLPMFLRAGNNPDKARLQFSREQCFVSAK